MKTKIAIAGCLILACAGFCYRFFRKGEAEENQDQISSDRKEHSNHDHLREVFHKAKTLAITSEKS